MTAPLYQPSRPVRIGAACAAVLTFGLCVWQVRRDGERNAGREAAELVVGQPALGDEVRLPEAAAWRELRWQGRWAPEVALMSAEGPEQQRGYAILGVFVRADGERVLVHRGWVPADAAEAAVAALQAAGGGAGTLEGQLRPTTDGGEAPAILGHGTRIWAYGQWAAAAGGLDAHDGAYVVSGTTGGGRSKDSPALDGYIPVPPRDDTSLHYASQWISMSILFTFLALPSAVNRVLAVVRGARGGAG